MVFTAAPRPNYSALTMLLAGQFEGRAPQAYCAPKDPGGPRAQNHVFTEAVLQLQAVTDSAVVVAFRAVHGPQSIDKSGIVLGGPDHLENSQ